MLGTKTTSFYLVCLCFLSNTLFAQDKKGDVYFYWGWNRAWYTNSDISFRGTGYDFTLFDVRAKDRPTAFDPGVYFHLGLFTIPQYNFRVGYFLSSKYQISLGIDHMKYVVMNPQLAAISGYIRSPQTTHLGEYNQDSMALQDHFLAFEHTDGLNYINTEIRRNEVIKVFKHIDISATGGLGLGFLYPKTNTTLLDKPRYDEFHLAGYGLDAVIGLNMRFWRCFFIQSELKGGFIHMPDIRTTQNKEDRASQLFFYNQFNWVLGFQISLDQDKE